jgi:hypothetical protein
MATMSQKATPRISKVYARKLANRRRRRLKTEIERVVIRPAKR